jgi:hypothetical protein
VFIHKLFEDVTELLCACAEHGLVGLAMLLLGKFLNQILNLSKQLKFFRVNVLRVHSYVTYS